MESQQLGLVKCTNVSVNEQAIEVWKEKELEEVKIISEDAYTMEKEGGIEFHITEVQKLPTTRYSKRIQNQMVEEIYGVELHGRKRSFSGTNLFEHNSFSMLDVDNISKLACNMGVEINDTHFNSVNLMKDLEVARHALDKTKERVYPELNKELHEEDSKPTDDIPLLEWLDDDSEAESFTLVQSKKKKKKQDHLRLEHLVAHPLIGRSRRSTPSVYRNKGSRNILTPQ
jgi:hypothetical protein